MHINRNNKHIDYANKGHIKAREFMWKLNHQNHYLHHQQQHPNITTLAVKYILNATTILNLNMFLINSSTVVRALQTHDNTQLPRVEGK